MNGKSGQSVKGLTRCVFVALLALMVLSDSSEVKADETDAKRILKAMSDYVGAQKSIALEYDAILEIVTKEDQKLALASSGTVTFTRPDRIHATRSGGFADVEMFFDGKTFTVLGKNLRSYP